MDEIFGLPAHPLVVHIPVAMLPLAALGVAVMMIRRAWYERYKWAVLVVGAIGTVGAVIATSTGEDLEHQIGQQDGAAAARAVHDHAGAGDLARTLAIVFFAALAAYVLVPWYLDRRAAAAAGDEAAGDQRDVSVVAVDHGPPWMRPLLMTVVALTAVASMVSVVNAGHSGASRAWEAYHGQTVAGD